MTSSSRGRNDGSSQRTEYEHAISLAHSLVTVDVTKSESLDNIVLDREGFPHSNIRGARRKADGASGMAGSSPQPLDGTPCFRLLAS